MESLPLEITSNILLRLSVKTLGQLKCVSKTFKTLITSPYFTKTHHNQTQRRRQLLLSTSSLHTLNIFHNQDQQTLRPVSLPIPSNPKSNCSAIELVGSCNGLVCLYYPPNTYSFLNPTTRELRVLPDPDTLQPDARVRMYGFGYVSKFDDFMVVSVGAHESVIRVFSAKADLWKTVRTRLPLPDIPWAKRPVYVNNVVHWFGFVVYEPFHHILGFDFVNEEFKELPLCEDMNQRTITALGVLDGSLCVISRGRAGGFTEHGLDMWVMKEYGVGESWIRIIPSLPIVYPDRPFLSPICYVGCEILLLADFWYLVLYNSVNGTVTTLEVELQGRECTPELVVAVYEESLVSPYDYICKDEGRYICKQLGIRRQ